MSAVEKAKAEVEGIERKIRGAEKRLRELTEGRPSFALRAERGDPAGLQKLDAQIDAAKREVETLQDAAQAARWQKKVTMEQAVVPFIEARRNAGVALRKALSSLCEGIKRIRDANAKLAESARELGVRVQGPDVMLAVLAEIGAAFDVNGLAAQIAQLDARPRPEGFTSDEWAHEIGRLKDGIAIEFPSIRFGAPTFEQEEGMLDAALAEFRKRADSPGPKKRMPPRPEDQASGGLAGFGSVGRP